MYHTCGATGAQVMSDWGATHSMSINEGLDQVSTRSLLL
jgi:hypothetical protein